MDKLLYPLALLVCSCNCLFSQNWLNVGEGIEKNIYDLISYEGNLYAGGRAGVKYWNGNIWNNTNSLFGIFCPLTLEEYNEELYTSGDFNGSNGSPTKVFKWQDGEWIQQGEDFSGADWNSVKKLKKFGNHLYAGGKFELIGNVQAKNIARWDGESWKNVGDGIPYIISEMESFQDKLLVCHSKIDTIPINDSTIHYIPRKKLQILENNVWVDLDSVFEYKNVNLLGVINDTLYFGSKDTINGLPIHDIGIWDGVNIYSIGDTLFNSINHIQEYDNEVYACCKIKTSNPFTFLSVIRKYVNNEWITVGGVFNDHILALDIHNDRLIIGGFFDEYENIEMNHISMIDHSTKVIELERKSEIQFSPNPTKSEIEVIAKEGNLLSLELFSMDGRVLKTWGGINQKKIIIHISELPDGIYPIKIYIDTSSKSVIDKIIKLKD